MQENNDTAPAQAEEATPVKTATPASKFEDRLKVEIHELGEDAVEMFDKVVEGVEDWYTRHYHKAATVGKMPIDAKDKDDLIKTVTASVTR